MPHFLPQSGNQRRVLGRRHARQGSLLLLPRVFLSRTYRCCLVPQDASCSSSASTSRNFRNHQVCIMPSSLTDLSSSHNEVNTSFEKEEGRSSCQRTCGCGREACSHCRAGMDEEEEIDESKLESGLPDDDVACQASAQCTTSKTSGNKDSLQVLEVLNGCRRVCASAFQERTECNLDSLKLGNQTGSGVVAKLFNTCGTMSFAHGGKWSKEKEDIKQ